MKKWWYRWEMVLLLMLLAELMIFGMINPRFLNVANLLYGTSDFVQIGMVALPLTLVMIAGGIDISFASSIGLCAIVFGLSHHFGASLPIAIISALLTGVGCGLLNGILIGISKIQALVMTLGTMYLFSGAATVLSGSIGAGGFEGIGGFPERFVNMAYVSIWQMPLFLCFFWVEALILFYLLHFTRFGRQVYLCGLSESATRYSGVHLPTIQALCHMLLGFFAACAALMMSAYFGSARTDLGTNTLLPAITAVVLGGASIYGGQGSIVGTLLATFIVGFLQQGLQMAGVSSQMAAALSGALLVCAVLLRQGGVVAKRFVRVFRSQTVNG